MDSAMNWVSGASYSVLPGLRCDGLLGQEDELQEVNDEGLDRGKDEEAEKQRKMTEEGVLKREKSDG